MRGLLERAKAAGLDKVLENVGELQSNAISALYDSLDIFVFPSLVESFGLPLVEALAKRLPIVAADTPGNREIAGNAGLFFAPTNSDLLAAIIGEIIDNASLREAKSAASLRRAQNFSWRRAAEQTLDLIERAIKSRAP